MILWLALAVIITAALVGGCTASSKVMSYSRLVDDLKKAGYSVQAGDEVEQPFFTVKARVIKVSNEDVQVFEYRDEATMQAQASLVSQDGFTIGNAMVDWIAPPHFYKAGRIIALYVGTNATVTGALQGVLGAQFAGQ
jgi:hypothetical protein